MLRQSPFAMIEIGSHHHRRVVAFHLKLSGFSVLLVSRTAPLTRIKTIFRGAQLGQTVSNSSLERKASRVYFLERAW